MKVPRELDELMWAVAEQRDPETNEQFLERYPEFESELDKRVQMVASLKGSRPRKSPPDFVPRETVRRLGPSRLAVAGVAVLVLASVTFATYATVKFVNSKRPAKENVYEAPNIVFNPPTQPFVSTTGSTGGPDDMSPQKPPLNNEPAIGTANNTFDPYKGLVTIESEDTELSSAIENIAAMAGLHVTLAPGFEDKRIKISYVNQPAIDVIEILGSHFGFKAVKEGTVDILIIPVKDAGPVKVNTGPGSVGTVGAGDEDGPVKRADTQGTTGGADNNPAPQV